MTTLNTARICVATLTAMMLSAGIANAQNRLHSGRITKSFTEPIERCVAATAEGGIIVQTMVREGQKVKIGDTLAKINQKVLLASLEIAKARSKSKSRLDAATSQMELTKSQLDAIQSLVDGGHTNKFEVEQREAEYQRAFAEFRLAEDELQLNKLEVDRIQAQINDRTIKSPIDGIVIEIHKQLGENVSNNEPQYATVVRVDELKVRFYLDAHSLRAAKVGSKIDILVGFDRKKTQAEVVYVSPVIDPDSGLGRLDIKIDNHDYAIQSGIICYWIERTEQESNSQQAAKNDRSINSSF